MELIVISQRHEKATKKVRFASMVKKPGDPRADCRSRQLLSGATRSAASFMNICKRRQGLGLAVAVLGPRRAGVGAVVGG